MLIQKINENTGEEYLGKVTTNEIDFELDKNYYHNQTVPSDTWTITHNLNKVPSITIIDSSNRVVSGEVEVINNNEITLYFNGAFSGKAYLN